MMRTTLTLDEDIAERLHELARKRRSSFKAVVNETLRRGLTADEDAGTIEAFVVEARPMGLRSGVQLDDIGELLEQVDGPDHK